MDLPRSIETIRSRYDPVAAELPAHVSVLVPFLNPDSGMERGTVTAHLQTLVQRFQPFQLESCAVNYFVGEPLHPVYLSLAAHVALSAVIDSVYQQFPECPPYGGRHPEVIPHITVGRVLPGDLPLVLDECKQALAELGGRVTVRASSITWIQWDGCH